MTIPSVSIIIADNGASAAQNLPLSNVQVVLGCATGGTVNLPTATTNPATLVANFVGGPLVEAAGLVCANGGTVIAMALPIVTTGTATAVIATVPGSSTSVVTVTLDGTNGAWDDYNVRMKCLTGGTIGTTGIVVQISLDAGRNYGPLIALGTAVTYAISNSGLTLNFAAGTMVAKDYWSFSTAAPKWNAAGVAAALAILGASQYAVQGWGSLHLVGSATAGECASVQSNLDTFATQFVYTRAITSARDAAVPTAWGGSTETESAWISSLATAFSAQSTKRVCTAAGCYNTKSPFPNASAGAPAYRRSLAWSDAVRRVLVATQRRGGAVSDGNLTTIVVDPASDPGDGFIYHDERVTPGLDAARFMTAMTWIKRQGFYVCQERLMSPTGSQFTELVLGNVIDVASDIGYATGVQEISSDLRLTAAGTLFEADALQLQGSLNAALADGMVSVGMVSDAFAVVNLTANVLVTKTIPIAISIRPKGYIDFVVETINLQAS